MKTFNEVASRETKETEYIGVFPDHYVALTTILSKKDLKDVQRINLISDFSEDQSSVQVRIILTEIKTTSQDDNLIPLTTMEETDEEDV